MEPKSRFCSLGVDESIFPYCRKDITAAVRAGFAAAHEFLLRRARGIVKIQYLPYDCTASQLVNFFKTEPYSVPVMDDQMGIHIVRRKDGTIICAFALFSRYSYAERATCMDGYLLGTRRLGIVSSTPSEVQLTVCEALLREPFDKQMLSQMPRADLVTSARVIVGMKYIPYNCSAKEIVDFFASQPNPCSVMGGEMGVLQVFRSDGSSSNACYVMFSDDQQADRAVSKNFLSLGTQRVSVFLCPLSKIKIALNPHLEPRPYEFKSIRQTPVPAFLPRNLILTGTDKDCLRLTGVPTKAEIRHIVEFFGDNACYIALHGIHAVDGLTTGEAFVRMISTRHTFKVANELHLQKMVFENRNWCIQVVPICGDDMKSILNSVTAPQSSQGNPEKIRSPFDYELPTRAYETYYKLAGDTLDLRCPGNAISAEKFYALQIKLHLHVYKRVTEY